MCETPISRISPLLVVAICLTCGGIVRAQLPEPVGFWRFQEGSGTTTGDTGTGGHPGTLVGNVAFVEDAERGTVLEFGAGKSYVDTNAWITELGTADFSIAAWIQTRDEGAAILAKSNEDSSWSFHEKQFYLSAGSEQGQPVAGGVHFYGNQAGEIWGKTAVNDGSWHHVCVTWDNDTDEQHIYVDGVLDDLRPVWVYYGGRGDNATDQVRIGFDCSGDALSDFVGRMDDVAIFNMTLTPDQVVELMHLALPATAAGPNPYDRMTDLPPQAIMLGWNPGMYAVTHDVYFGTAFNDVNDASRTNPLNVLLSEGQSQDYYPLNGALDLELGTTYYWRVDEVNGAPDYTIHRGDVWQFTTELIAYPIAGDGITATASTQAENQGPENTVNGSGLSDDRHSDDPTTMWLTASGAAGPAWIKYEFDKVYKLAEMWVWNHNGRLESAIGFGCKDVSVQYSADDIDYALLETASPFVRAPGKPGYTHNTTVDFGGVPAKYVRLTISSNWGGILPQYGLSEVRFFSIPVFARKASPASGETEVAVDATLSWRRGREAAQHHVYISTDQQAVIDGTAPAATVTGTSYTPALDLAGTYYWRIDEVNEAETPSVWPGEVWSFSTEAYVVVDDFESYTDDMDAEEAIFQNWIDGVTDGRSGSTVGYFEAPFAEKTIIHGGRQSMPLAYDNTMVMYSEAKRTFVSPQDWSRHSIKSLVLWFHGGPDNAAQQMYVKINNAKVLYNGVPEDLKREQWQMWYIDLASLNVGSVTSLSIGFDRLNGVGGQGMVFVDDIRLYSSDPQSIASDDPGTAGL